ncbi:MULTISPECIES: alginate export family protein [unclassified Marinobacter]|uniref:alginate export family protein n=1 Tax=unclassified Marinobacter TaxID=83889 RepID=UPI0026E1F282|nr:MULTISPECIES: alginate export family protein [unclassified Marinobacter]MDO6441729.1 alginate export family protein [Marinobacter sp. 2_MG-2023]MDO6824897.1 alginate export family protein [Marinobacter sp. 1_MG-2023]
MKERSIWISAGMLGALIIATPALAEDQTLYAALSQGEVSGNVRLRYESVDQDNTLEDADALTVRTRLGYTTGNYKGITGVLEFEDSRNVLGVDDYNNTLGKNPNYSIIPDPETTEVDQAYLQYSGYNLRARGGRQVITYDNQRHVGHVGWRQDRQTFDAVRLTYTPSTALSLDYAFINQRNRIFAEAGDLPSNDHLLNLGYQTGFGKLSAYAYLLEIDDGTDNGLDTMGLRYAGDYKMESMKFVYAAEYATQEAETGSSKFDTDYYSLKAGLGVSGITIAMAYEVLGSDDGNYGFATPLATLHVFNGWSDQFLATPANGLEDISLTVAGGLAGGKWAIEYHDFSADESTPGVNDLGDEFGVSYTRSFAKHYTAGIKYAMYSAGDSAAGKVDTNKLWLTLSAAL